MRSLIFLLLLIVGKPILMLGQTQPMNNINFQSSYLFEVPGGDLADRYGNDNKFEFKLERLINSSYAVYANAGVRFNQNVKEDVLSSLRTKNGFIIGVNGFYADVFGRKRGYDLGLGFDKLFSVKKQLLRIGVSGTYLTHWVKIVDDSNALPAVLDKSGQYFDRFVSGFGVEENIQYQINLDNNIGALLLGLQIGQFFTKEHRFALIPDSTAERRFDLYFGAKVTYLLPLYKFGKAAKVYY